MRCACARIHMSFSSTMTCSRGRSGVSGTTARAQVRAVFFKPQLIRHSVISRLCARRDRLGIGKGARPSRRAGAEIGPIHQIL